MNHSGKPRNAPSSWGLSSNGCVAQTHAEKGRWSTHRVRHFAA